MNAKTQILAAAVLGTAAFKKGIACAPALDDDLRVLLAGRRIGETPVGEASSVKIMSTWIENWIMASLA